jgi:hypothetical protein
MLSLFQELIRRNDMDKQLELLRGIKDAVTDLMYVVMILLITIVALFLLGRVI